MLSFSKNNLRNKKYFNKGKLRYSAKKYSNPFFVKKRGRPDLHFQNFTLPRALKLSIIFVLVVICVTTYFFFYSSYFDIKKIEITGEGRISNESIEEMVWAQINNNFFIFSPQRNIFLFDKLLLSL